MLESAGKLILRRKALEKSGESEKTSRIREIFPVLVEYWAPGAV